MKAKRLLTLLLAVVLILGSCVACGAKKEENAEQPAEKTFSEYTLEDWNAYAAKLNEEGKDHYKLLYLVSWAASEYFVNSYDDWKTQFEQYNWELDMIGPTAYTSESQLSVLEAALISKEYDGIILYPIDPNTFYAVKDDFWETYHVPIIDWADGVKDSCGQYCVMGNNFFQTCGEFMAQNVINYVDANADYFKKYEGEGIPTFYAGQAYNPTQNARLLRAKEVLEADGRFNTVLYDENVADENAIKYCESMMQNHPEVEIGVMYNDVLAVYYEYVLEQNSHIVSDHLGLFGVDAISASAKLMKEKGEACYVKSSVGYNNTLVGDIIHDIFSVGVPASKEGIVVDGVTDKAVEKITNGDPELGSIYIEMTYKTVDNFYPDL